MINPCPMIITVYIFPRDVSCRSEVKSSIVLDTSIIVLTALKSTQ